MSQDSQVRIERGPEFRKNGYFQNIIRRLPTSGSSTGETSKVAVVGLGQYCMGWVSCWQNNSVKDCLTITLTQSSAYAHDSKKIQITFLGQKGKKLSNFTCSFNVLLLPLAVELLVLLAIAVIGVVDDLFVLNAKDWEVQSQHNLRHLNATVVLRIFLDSWEQGNYKGDEPEWLRHLDPEILSLKKRHWCLDSFSWGFILISSHSSTEILAQWSKTKVSETMPMLTDSSLL